MKKTDGFMVEQNFWKRKDTFFLGGAFLLPLVWLGILRYLMIPTGECSSDDFYHMGMAKLGFSAILAKTFPWMTVSVWGDQFADKEMLYHSVLSLLAKIQTFLCGPLEPPFHFAALFFIALVIAAFLFAGRRLGASGRTLFAASLLFCLVIPNFTYRLMMLRPHLFSLALMFLMIGGLAGGSFRFRLCWTFGLSFIYAWSYSNPHFIVIPVLFFALADCLRGSWKSLWLPPLALFAVGLGLLIHPQFPNSLLIWKLQSWDALVSPMLANNPLPRPQEMLSPSFRWHLPALPLYGIVYLNCLILTRLAERKGVRNVAPELWAMFGLSLLFVFGTFAALRAVEYAAPFSCLLFVVLFDRALEEKILLPFRSRPVAARYVLFFACLSLALLTSIQSIHSVRRVECRPIRSLAAWLKANVPEGQTVVNVDWSDFPQLFYFDPTHRYLWGMDPVFALAKSPEKVKLLLALRPGHHIPPPPEQFASVFNSSYAVLVAPRYQQAAFLRNSGWLCVYEGDDGWVFRLSSSL